MTTAAAIRREGNSWFLLPITDTTEAEHRVDLLAGRLYCTCQGFLRWQHCKHQDQVREDIMTNSPSTQLIHVEDSMELPDVWRSPTDLARRLQDMKQERALIQEFFKDVMVPSRVDSKGVSLADGDYGIIPGTDKPTLFKPGAEKLCELYGYAPIVADLQETADYETGHYRVVVRIALIHKGSGVKVAEGIGECNTRESRYFYRWAYKKEAQATLGVDPDTLPSIKFKEYEGQYGPYRRYRLENDDLFSLWNTILKMGKKRALVDATLSATRSSGIFTQSATHLDEWVDADYEVVDTPAQRPTPAAEQPAKEAAPSKQEPAPEKEPEQATGPSIGQLRNKVGKVLEGLKDWDEGSRNRSLVFLHQTWPDAFDVPNGKKADVTKLDATQCGHVISLLQPDHDHDPAYDAGGTMVCRVCLCPLPETQAAGASEAQAKAAI